MYKELKYCRRRRKRWNYKQTQGLISSRVLFDKRPKILEELMRFGDVKVDLIMGKNHKSALLVIVNRATLLTTIDKLEGKNLDVITKIIIERIKKLPQLKTTAFDNLLAFVQY